MSALRRNIRSGLMWSQCVNSQHQPISSDLNHEAKYRTSLDQFSAPDQLLVNIGQALDREFLRACACMYSHLLRCCSHGTLVVHSAQVVEQGLSLLPKRQFAKV